MLTLDIPSSKILEPNSENFPKLYGENLITQQSSSTNLNLNQAIKNFDKAEELIFKEMTTGAGNDIEQATSLARKMVCEWGMSDTLGPMSFGKKNEEVFKMISKS